jgi:hypothetical protein
VRVSPDGVTERVSLEQAGERLSFSPALPAELPPGYGLASAELVRLGDAIGLNVYFQQADADLGSGLIRLHLEAATALPPASSAAQSAVEVRGAGGRWTPDRHQLEWVDGGVYYSLDAPGLDLAELLAVAGTIAPAPAPPGSPLPSPVVSPSAAEPTP